MKATLFAVVLAVVVGSSGVGVPAQSAATPYKLGTFAEGGRTFLGLVLDDSVVIDLSKADPSLPSEMKQLLERYDSVRPRLAEIAAGKTGRVNISAVKTLPPVMPRNILNAAVNYTEHAQEMAAHESPRTTKLYDRTKERLTQDEVERIRL